jgi:hypothetical protein
VGNFLFLQFHQPSPWYYFCILPVSLFQWQEWGLFSTPLKLFLDHQINLISRDTDFQAQIFLVVLLGFECAMVLSYASLPHLKKIAHLHYNRIVTFFNQQNPLPLSKWSHLNSWAGLG